MNQELYNFLKDQITSIQEKYNQSLPQAQRSDMVALFAPRCTGVMASWNWQRKITPYS